MKGIDFTTVVKQWENISEKSGWTYVDIPSDLAEKLKPGNRRSFRVKGTLDQFKISQVALMPMGSGRFILPINAVMRKGTGKKKGAMLRVRLQADEAEFPISKDLMTCLADEPAAKAFFLSLTASHKRYFSNWIDGAKAAETKAKRIAIALNSLLLKQNYGEMIRAQTEKNKEIRGR